MNIADFNPTFQEQIRKALTGVPAAGVGRSIAAKIERERDLHEAILSECARRGWLPIHGRMDVASTTTVGSPDFVILADAGKVLFIECKVNNGKLSVEQLAFHAWAKRLSHTIHTIYSIEEFNQLAKGEEL